MKSAKALSFALLFFCFTIVFAITKNLKAQGCSDAGFCSIHSLKPDEHTESVLLNQVKAGISYGRGENSVKIISPYLEYTRNLNSCLSISGKILFTSVKGDLGDVSGMSDGFISASYSAGNNTGLTLGFKIPFNDGNSAINNLSLPMAYQTSLGTLDIIAGINHSHDKFEFTAALQQPLTQNKNTFAANLYPAGSEAQLYQSTKNYKRSGDVLLRAAYTFDIDNGKFKITPGILPIFHLANDKYTDANGIEQSIDGSQGVTLNGNLFLVYEVSKKNSIELSFGAPMKSRTIRPDGLTRKFALSLEYKARF